VGLLCAGLRAVAGDAHEIVIAEGTEDIRHPQSSSN
jgi:hypothetical protein